MLKELASVIDTLHKEVPRLYVGLVAMLNLTSLSDNPEINRHCVLEHFLTRVESGNWAMTGLAN